MSFLLTGSVQAKVMRSSASTFSCIALIRPIMSSKSAVRSCFSMLCKRERKWGREVQSISGKWVGSGGRRKERKLMSSDAQTNLEERQGNSVNNLEALEEVHVPYARHQVEIKSPAKYGHQPLRGIHRRVYSLLLEVGP